MQPDLGDVNFEMVRQGGFKSKADSIGNLFSQNIRTTLLR